MKQEKAFSKNGAYSFILDSNLLLHKQVSSTGRTYLQSWLQAFPKDRVLNILDLACGGEPRSISDMIEPITDRKFKYTGIDINPDQVNSARAFKYASNLVQTTIFEGNAWDFTHLKLEDSYEIIFTGMNLHHGTPEEVYCLLVQCKSKLSAGGIFINHDFYRPASYSYLRRPQKNPKNPDESFAMIDEKVIDSIFSRAGSIPFFESGPEWRNDLIKRYVIAMKLKGAPQEGIDEVMEHVLARDFPISLPEMKAIASKAGLEFHMLELDAKTEPLSEFFSLVVAKKPGFEPGQC